MANVLSCALFLPEISFFVSIFQTGYIEVEGAEMNDRIVTIPESVLRVGIAVLFGIAIDMGFYAIAISSFIESVLALTVVKKLSMSQQLKSGGFN